MYFIMKTLVCLLGQVRFPELTWGPWKKWVLDHLAADLILCGNIDTESKFTENAIHVFKPGPIRDMSLLDHLKGGILGKDSKTSGRMQLSLRTDLWHHLIENNLHDKYDRYIISRTDNLWSGPYPDLDNEHIWCVNAEFHLGLCDRHMTVPQRFLEPALTVSTFEDPEALKQVLIEKLRMGYQFGYYNVLFTIESFIYCRFIERGLERYIGLSPFPMYLADGDGKPRIIEETRGSNEVLTWPYVIAHNHLSENGLFSGRAYKV